MFIIKKVLIIFGGNSTEHYISCKSCKNIVKNIDQNKFKIKMVGIDFDSNWYEYNGNIKLLEKGKWKQGKITKIKNIINYLKKFDVIFPIIHGYGGEDGKLQGLLEMFNIKYVGCNSMQSSIFMDKEETKLFLNSLNIKQVPYISIKKDCKIKRIEEELNYPLIVKPANGGSSIGISKASNTLELRKAIEEAFRYDEKIIVEEYIDAREIEIAVIEDENKLIISNPGEILSANEYYDYEAKYQNHNSKTVIIKDFREDLMKKTKEYINLIYNSIGIRHYARIDFFYKEGEIYLNEINTIPGFTEISMYPILMKDLSISFSELITKLINCPFNT